MLLLRSRKVHNFIERWLNLLPLHQNNMKKILFFFFALLPFVVDASTIETQFVKTMTKSIPSQTENQWNKFEFGASKIKWYKKGFTGEEQLSQSLTINSIKHGIQNDSVQITNYQATSASGKFNISKKVYRQKNAGYRSVITVDWTSPHGHQLPTQNFYTETAKGQIIETSLFKFEQGSYDSEFVPMHNTIIFSPTSNKFYIVNDDGNQTVFKITSKPIEQTSDGVSISIFKGKVGSMDSKFVNMLPENPSEPVMFCLVHMIGDVEAMKEWYCTESSEK